MNYVSTMKKTEIRINYEISAQILEIADCCMERTVNFLICHQQNIEFRYTSINIIWNYG